MSVEYDKYYQTENLFGEPYPELIAFYSAIPKRGKLLDLGCGQGRDAIALAKLGYEVTGIDYSIVGIDQLNAIAKKEQLTLTGVLGDTYEYAHFDAFDFILLDSMFHFGKKEKAKEMQLLHRIFESVKPNALITICIQDVGKKVQVLDAQIFDRQNLQVIDRQKLLYQFEDKASNHCSSTRYEMITLKKSP